VSSPAPAPSYSPGAPLGPEASGAPCRRRGPDPISPSAEDGGVAMMHPGARYMHAVPGPHLATRLATGFTAALVRSPRSLRYSTAQPHRRATSPLALSERARASRGRTRPHCTRPVTPPPVGCYYRCATRTFTA
jgi:hypothetical protein